MAFRKKWHKIMAFDPDILVIQECENETRLKFGEITPKPVNFVWIGKNKSKGVGIFSYNENIKLELAEFYNPEYEYIIPIQVSGNNKFILYAIWAMPFEGSPSKSYVNQIWRAMKYYERYVTKHSILAADFNSNAIWDNKYKTGNHTNLVNFLDNRNLISLYHEFNNEEQGLEKTNTIYLLKNIKKPYHMDYCFASLERIGSNTSLEIGHYKDWILLSDHMPIIIKRLE